MKPVVIPLDGSERALVALPVARRLAELEAATLHLVHVSSDLAPPGEVLERIGLSGAALRGSVLDTKLGEPGSEIIAEAGELGAALIVMCTHTFSVGDTVGSTALAVLKGSPCPMVLVRPEQGLRPWNPRRILLPHDGTPVTSAAIRPAADLARGAGAELDVLYVADPGGSLPAERGSLAPPHYIDQPQHEWPAWVQEFIQRLTGCCPLESLRVRMSLAPGVPGEEILRFAGEHESDLIVLAWRGDWGGQHAPILKAVLGHAACPVMVVRVAL